MTNIRPDQDSKLVPPGYKPQPIRMSHRGGLVGFFTYFLRKVGRRKRLVCIYFKIKTNTRITKRNQSNNTPLIYDHNINEDVTITLS